MQIKENEVELSSNNAKKQQMQEAAKEKLDVQVNLVNIREENIQTLKETISKERLDMLHLETEKDDIETQKNEFEDELNLKADENNRLRKQVCDLEKSV